MTAGPPRDRDPSTADDGAEATPDDATETTGEDAAAGAPDAERIVELVEQLDELVDTEAERAQLRESVETELDVEFGPFGRVISGFDRGDAAEAFLGSIVFGIPMFVESGTQEIGTYLAGAPLAVVATMLVTVAVVVGIVYVSDFQDVRVHDPILGLVPRRLVGVLGISFGTAVVMMTVWGRVDWGAPAVALAQCTVAFVPMAIGAALSDLLPGT